MKFKWTKEQYDERERIMLESNLPLCGTPGVNGGWIGYVGSREMHADMCADDLYEHRKRMESMAKDLVNDLLSKPPSPMDNLPDAIKFLSEYIKDYTVDEIKQYEILSWIRLAQDFLNEATP